MTIKEVIMSIRKSVWKDNVEQANAKADPVLDGVLKKAVSSNWTPLILSAVVVAVLTAGVIIGAQF